MMLKYLLSLQNMFEKHEKHTKISEICSNLVVNHLVDATLTSLLLIVRKECSQMKWQAMNSMGAQTRFWEKIFNVFLSFTRI